MLHRGLGPLCCVGRTYNITYRRRGVAAYPYLGEFVLCWFTVCYVHRLCRSPCRGTQAANLRSRCPQCRTKPNLRKRFVCITPAGESVPSDLAAFKCLVKSWGRPCACLTIRGLMMTDEFVPNLPAPRLWRMISVSFARGLKPVATGHGSSEAQLLSSSLQSPREGCR